LQVVGIGDQNRNVQAIFASANTVHLSASSGWGFFDAVWGYRRRSEGVDLYDEGPGKDFLTPPCHSAGSRIGLGRENINDDRM
jgi:hypothetical protein